MLFKLPISFSNNSAFDTVSLPFMSDEFFDIMHQVMSRYHRFSENSIVTDYLYTIILQLLSEYKDQIVVFGSNMLNKKYGTSNITK